jgi:hypothetical protein
MKTGQPSIFGPRTANPGGDLTEGTPDELAQLAALLLKPKQILDTLEAMQDPDEPCGVWMICRKVNHEPPAVGYHV